MDTKATGALIAARRRQLAERDAHYAASVHFEDDEALARERRHALQGVD